MSTIHTDPVLKVGDYIELYDGRVRGPIIEGSDPHGEKVFLLEHNYDTDLHLGWWFRGTYAKASALNDFDRSRDVRRTLTLQQAIDLPNSCIALPKAPPGHKLVGANDMRIEPVLMNQREREYLMKLVRNGMMSVEQAREEMLAPQQRTSAEIYSTFALWIAGRRPESDGHLEPLDTFAAGYNAALRNEIGEGNRPSENAQGGPSESKDLVNAYRKGFEDAFGGTSEGYNCEYPFQRKGINFKTDDDWNRFYGAFLAEADLTSKPEPKLPPIPTPEDLADAMLQSIGKNLAGMGSNHRDLWIGMAKTAIEKLRGPDTETHPWKPQATYKPGNHPAHIEADMALEAAIEEAI